MFSFFLPKKKSSPTEDAPAAESADDYIFVEKKSPSDPPRAPPNNNSVYPEVPQTVYLPQIPGYPMSGFGRATSVESSNQHFLDGVPFELSPQLSSKAYDIVQLQVDGILAALTKQMQMEGDYTFKLEKEILDYEI